MLVFEHSNNVHKDSKKRSYCVWNVSPNWITVQCPAPSNSEDSFSPRNGHKACLPQKREWARGKTTAEWARLQEIY
jgi:hypothetical protein